MPDFTNLQGWAGPATADKAWAKHGDSLPKFFIAGQAHPTQGKTFRAWDVCRKLFDGKDIVRTIQESGDCVGMAMVDVINAIQAIQIVLGNRDKFMPVLCSFIYAHSRVIVGKNELKGSAGAVGSWMAKTVSLGGSIGITEDPRIPEYSGKLSDTWGDDKKHAGTSFRDFLPLAGDNLMGSAARIQTWSELRDGVINAKLGTIASNRGYAMKPNKDGFHQPSGSWCHQMSILALCDDPKLSWVGLGNQWGDVHGTLTDFETGERWPSGMLRVERSAFEKKHLTQDAECYLYSTFSGFPDETEALSGMLI